MATTIKLKNSITTTSTPTTLVQGEVAINVTDKKLWVGNASSSPVLLSDTPSDTANTWTGKQTFNGTSSNLSSVFKNIGETTTISATAATGTINYDVTTQSILYYTTNASGNFTVNFRASSGTSLNTAMTTGQTVTAVFMVTNGSTAYYNSAVTIDGNSVTPKWLGGAAPSGGSVSAIDVYTYSITKTASATFTVLATVSQFK